MRLKPNISHAHGGYVPAAHARCCCSKDGRVEPRLAAGPGEFPGLEAFLAEHRAPLGRLERHRRFLAAVRARRDGLDPFASAAAGATQRPGSALRVARLGALRFVLEVLVREKLLFSGRPDELRATI